MRRSVWLSELSSFWLDIQLTKMVRCGVGGVLLSSPIPGAAVAVKRPFQRLSLIFRGSTAPTLCPSGTDDERPVASRWKLGNIDKAVHSSQQSYPVIEDLFCKLLMSYLNC